MHGRRLALIEKAGPRRLAGERHVDRREDGGRRAEREIERHALEGLLRLATSPLESAPHLAEKLRRCALEGENRLFLVADREYRAVPRTRALAGKELLGQRLDDAPLLGRIVLRLVDQHMVEAVIELLHHPSGARMRHQRQRAGNLVGKVQRATLGLSRGEGLEDRACDREEGDAAFQRLGGAALLAQAFQTRLLTLEVLFQSRELVAQLLAREMTLFPATWIALAVLDEEGGQQRLDPLRPFHVDVSRMERSRELPVLVLAGGEVLRPPQSASAADVAAQHLGLDASGCFVFGQAEPAAQRLAVGCGVAESFECLRKVQRLLEQLGEAECAGLTRDEIERRLANRRSAKLRDGLVARLDHQRSGLALVDHLEMRGDVGLEREQLQQPLAEGVQGLNS